jgi:hypothetical protein
MFVSATAWKTNAMPIMRSEKIAYTRTLVKQPSPTASLLHQRKPFTSIVAKRKILSKIGPLANPKIPVTGTWDDHDYGYNNNGDNYQCRKPSQDEFVIHFNIPSSDVRHPNQGTNQQEGIYSSNMFSKPGGGNGIHLINLDARYHRSPTFSDYGSCKGSESKMLRLYVWVSAVMH